MPSRRVRYFTGHRRVHLSLVNHVHSLAPFSSVCRDGMAELDAVGLVAASYCTAVGIAAMGVLQAPPAALDVHVIPSLLERRPLSSSLEACDDVFAVYLAEGSGRAEDQEGEEPGGDTWNELDYCIDRAVGGKVGSVTSGQGAGAVMPGPLEEDHRDLEGAASSQRCSSLLSSNIWLT